MCCLIMMKVQSTYHSVAGYQSNKLMKKPTREKSCACCFYSFAYKKKIVLGNKMITSA